MAPSDFSFECDGQIFKNRPPIKKYRDLDARDKVSFVHGELVRFLTRKINAKLHLTTLVAVNRVMAMNRKDPSYLDEQMSTLN